MAEISKKRSPIWKHFMVAKDEKFATCQHCNKLVSRGGKDRRTYNTTNLVRHLETDHQQSAYKEYSTDKQEYDDKQSAVKKAGSVQLTLEESKSRVQEWTIHDPRAHRVHRRLGEMLALDIQPFTIVEDQGFCRLVHTLEPRYVMPSRKFFSENIIPRIEKGVRSEVRKSLESVQYFSFTTDAWTADVANHSLLSVTAHWISDNFTRKSAILNAVVLNDSHTGAYLCEQLQDSLAKWDIKDSQVHLFLRDNASNMIRAMKDAGYASQGCMAHTLQLVVKDGILTQRTVVDLLAICRRVVSHFKHSSTACKQLLEIQQNLGLP